MEKYFQGTREAFLHLIQLPIAVLHNVFLSMGLGVIPGGNGGLEGSERRPAEPSGPVAAGHGSIMLQPGHYWASIAVALLVPELPALNTPFLSGMPMGEAILRCSKYSSLGLAQPGAVVFNTTTFCVASLYIFAHAFEQFSGDWTLFSSPNAFPLHHLPVVCSSSGCLESSCWAAGGVQQTSLQLHGRLERGGCPAQPSAVCGTSP